MAQSLDLFLNLESLFGIASSELNADDKGTPSTQQQPGRIAFGVNAFGFSIYRYAKTQQSGGQSKGELAARIANVTGTVTAASGEVNDTTHLADTSNFTAGNEEGKLCVITDNADSAGAAPEGEVAVISDSTTSQLTFDGGYALTTAPATSDTYTNLSIFHHDDAADGDLAINVMGVLMADRTAAYYGWVQVYGYNPGTLYTTSAVTAGNPIVADAAAVGPHGSDTEQLWVGHAPIAVAADLASPFRTLAFLDLWHASQPIA